MQKIIKVWGGELQPNKDPVLTGRDSPPKPSPSQNLEKLLDPKKCAICGKLKLEEHKDWYDPQLTPPGYRYYSVRYTPLMEYTPWPDKLLCPECFSKAVFNVTYAPHKLREMREEEPK
ncbi:MAG: hypothetical protein DDT19_00088 [Syntrophomonadaceae bacterium]|nr:hypothetical protein [Bacillota bacterium]